MMRIPVVIFVVILTCIYLCGCGPKSMSTHELTPFSEKKEIPVEPSRASIKNKNQEDRITAIKKLTDEDLLSKIANNDDDEVVREAAVNRLIEQTSLSDMRAWVDPKLTSQLKDQGMLEKIAAEAKDAFVRKAAVENLADQDFLSEIVMKDKNKMVRMAAVSKIIDQVLLDKIFMKSQDRNIRKFVVKKLTSHALLTKIAVEHRDITIRTIAVNRLIHLGKAEHGNTFEKSTAGNNKKINSFDFSTMFADNDKPVPICGNDFCDKSENNSSCPADCFPQAVKPYELSGGDKAVFLDFVYKGQKSGIYFVVNRNVHEKLASLPDPLSYKKDKKEIKKDFIFPRINNSLQKENLLPLVEKIKSLTPDINKQARIAISLVQNIPYGFPIDEDSELDYKKKYPYGVIWEQTGICDEKSDLLLFLLRELGFGTATFIYKKEYHRTVGIKCPDAYDAGDTGYCYVEVTLPKIITDNISGLSRAGSLTDFTLIKISEGKELKGVEEEYSDKNLYYDLVYKSKIKDGKLEQDEYKLYNAILKKYGME